MIMDSDDPRLMNPILSLGPGARAPQEWFWLPLPTSQGLPGVFTKDYAHHYHGGLEYWAWVFAWLSLCTGHSCLEGLGGCTCPSACRSFCSEMLIPPIPLDWHELETFVWTILMVDFVGCQFRGSSHTFLWAVSCQTSSCWLKPAFYELPAPHSGVKSFHWYQCL